MTIPTFDEFIEPLLRVLHDHPDGLKAADAYEATADFVDLTEKQRDEMIPSGQQALYKNRIGWAHDRLKRADLSHSPSWGVWQLTDQGEELVETNPDGLDPEFIDEIARPRKSSDEREDDETSASDDLARQPAEETTQTPQERIDVAVEEINDSVADQLLELIIAESDSFFETLVLDVLREMGYGAGRGSITHRGGVNDAGIDGIISLDRLGLEKVYVQAKKWAPDNTVGRPQLQAFSGALQGQKASKGVFITTSSFSSHARRFAERVSDSIVLIDGERLTDLMIEYGVGVQTERTVQVVELERDYFEGGGVF